MNNYEIAAELLKNQFDKFILENIRYDEDSHQYLIDLDKFEYHVCDDEVNRYRIFNED